MEIDNSASSQNHAKEELVTILWLSEHYDSSH